MALLTRCDLDLAAGVLDLCLHLLQFGFTQDQRVIEQIFEHAVGIISVPQVRAIGLGLGLRLELP